MSGHDDDHPDRPMGKNTLLLRQKQIDAEVRQKEIDAQTRQKEIDAQIEQARLAAEVEKTKAAATVDVEKTKADSEDRKRDDGRSWLKTLLIYGGPLVVVVVLVLAALKYGAGLSLSIFGVTADVNKPMDTQQQHDPVVVPAKPEDGSEEAQ